MNSRYFIRALRYLLRMVIVIAVILLLMQFFGLIAEGEGNVFQRIFSTWQGMALILILVALAAAYPRTSFTTVALEADMEADSAPVREALSAYGYRKEDGDRDRAVYKLTSPVRRLLMQYDDRVTVTREGRYLHIEGHKRIVPRIELRLTSMLDQ